MNIKIHLKKSFACLPSYSILEDSADEMQDLNQDCEEKSNNFEKQIYIKTPNKDSFKKTKNNGSNKIVCINCKKTFVNILIHLKKSTKCQMSYNMLELSELQKSDALAAKKEKMAKFRENRTKEEKTKDEMKDSQRKERFREKRTEEKKLMMI